VAAIGRNQIPNRTSSRRQLSDSGEHMACPHLWFSCRRWGNYPERLRALG